MMSKMTPVLAVLGLCSAAVAGSSTFTEGFEGPSNVGNWSISGAGTIQLVGGNPDAWLNRSGLDTFAPIVQTGVVGDPFVGDFREMGVTQISFDAALRDRNFGDPVGFQMSLLLRDTKGTGDPSDDDYAYYVGPNVPLMGDGWVHYDFDVPSASTDPVPAGWSGGWAGDLESFRPGVDWNDVITNVDRVEIWWLHPAFAAIFSAWDVGVDNMSITTDVTTTCPGDGDGNNMIDTVDFLGLLADWGATDSAYDIAPDGGDGIVDTLDFLELLANWGPC